MRKKTIDKLKKYQNIILAVVIIMMLCFMTVGFALYGEMFEFSGGVTLKPDGKLEVLNVSLTDSSNVSSSETPVITSNSIEFNITFSGTNDAYYAVYTADIVNNSSYDYTYNDFQFTPTVNSSSGGVGILTLTVDGISNGDIISSGETRTITLTLNLEVSDKDQSYDASGTTDINTSQQEKGSVLVSTTVVDDDLTGTDNLGKVLLKVINSYSKDVSFTLSSSNSNFVVVSSDETDISTLSISANSEQEYDVYLKINDGSIFDTESSSTMLILRCNGIGNVTTDKIDLKVSITEEVDTEKPQIGEVSLVMNNTVGQADVSFTRLDSGGTSIVNYTILLYDATTDSLISTYNTNSALTEYSITDLSEGSYYVKVYGTDEAGNSGSEDIDSATTSNVYCRQSETVAMKWTFSVDTSGLDGLTSSGATTADIGTTYTTTLTASTFRTLPSSITVIMGGIKLTTADYTYDSSSGAVSIPNVSGDISISGTAGTCLIEGTKVRLANGLVKNVEDITYSDLLAVWNYETGSITYEYPIWIEKEQTTNHYQLTKFSDGTVLKTIGYHGIFNMDMNMFVSVDDMDNFKVGTRVAKIDEFGNIYTTKVESIELVNDVVNYYHVVSTRYYNIIANDFLTTDGTVILSNLFGFDKNITWGSIRDMVISDKNNLYTYQELDILPYYMFKGLRAEEGKHLINYGISRELFRFYLSANQLNKNMLLEPDMDIFGNRVWMVSNSDDIVSEINKKNYLIKEGNYYTLPSPSKRKNFLYWYNTGDGKRYNIGDKVQIWYGTYFEAVYE